MPGSQTLRIIACASITFISSCFAEANSITPNPSVAAPRSSIVVPSTPITSNVPAMTQPSTPVNVVQPTASAQVWNLKDADIRAVIQTISILTGKNFIIDPRVSGKITLVSEKPMTPDEMYQVFLSMLQILQYAAVPSGNIIKIVPSMDANSLTNQLATNVHPGRGDEIVVRVVPINRVSASELIPVVRPLMSQSGSISAYMPTNTLILAGTAQSIERVVDVIHQMDSANANQISIIRLKYANAKKVVSVIQNLQRSNTGGSAGQVSITADDDDNSILINANAANQMLTRNLIRQLDRQGSSSDDTRVVNLNYMSAKKLAPILAKVAEGVSATGAKGAPGAADTEDSSKISIQPEDSNNAIILHGPGKILNSLVRVIHKLDGRPREVLVEAIIVKVDENLLSKLGVQWGVPDNSSAGAAAGATPATAGSAVLTSTSLFPFQISGQGVGLLPNGNLLSLLRLFKKNGSSDVLATPSVVVLNNEKATIDDGQNLGLANRQYQSTNVPSTDTQLSPFTTVQRTDVTLSLDVTPHISPNRTIRMALVQQNDTVDPNTSSTSTNPTLDTSKVQTSVLVRSGDILVLGGLIQNQQVKTEEKIPVLGDLPLLGNFFRYKTHQMKKTCLMIFIRPVIMSKNSAHKQTMHRYEYARQQEIAMELERSPNRGMPTLPRLQKPVPVLPTPLSSPIAQLPMPVVTK